MQRMQLSNMDPRTVLYLHYRFHGLPHLQSPVTKIVFILLIDLSNGTKYVKIQIKNLNKNK